MVWNRARFGSGRGHPAAPGGSGRGRQTVPNRRTSCVPAWAFGSAYWQGLIDWLTEVLVGEGMIGEKDLELMQILEEPADIVEAIFNFYENRGFQPTREERARMLNL